ncbi:MAG TPA: hypothetical protein PLH19_08950, partial [Anaerolineae bacterium]|nr:hypothetical protein [Anaerolineae bacterium]HQH38643.1 hypothetical protein [Anaerolineae bacterium]
MARNHPLVSEERDYLVLDVQQAKQIVKDWLVELDLAKVIRLGLPEVDDRYHYWRVPLCARNGAAVGEVVIDAYSTEILASKTTKPNLLTARLLKQDESKVTETRQDKKEYRLSSLRSTVGLGDSALMLDEMPAESVDLVFTYLFRLVNLTKPLIPYARFGVDFGR